MCFAKLLICSYLIPSVSTKATLHKSGNHLRIYWIGSQLHRVPIREASDWNHFRKPGTLSYKSFNRHSAKGLVQSL